MRSEGSLWVHSADTVKMYTVDQAEVGKVTLKSNSDEALSDEFLLNSIGDEALNNVFP